MKIVLNSVSRMVQPTGICRAAANLVLGLSEYIAPADLVLVVAPWQTGYFKKDFGIEGKCTLVVPDIENTTIGRNWWHLMGFRDLVRRFQPDIAHCCYPMPYLGSKPAVMTIHDLYAFDQPSNFGKRAIGNRIVQSLFMRRMKELMCVSRNTYDRLVHWFPDITQRVPTVVIPTGIALPEPTQAPAGIAQDKKFILTVAQHRPPKRLHLLIQAYMACLREGKLEGIDLILAGQSGSSTPMLKQLVKDSGFAPRIQFVSGLADGELAWLYTRCLRFVVTSSEEGFCLPLVEAIGLGADTISSDIPVLREVAPGSAFVNLSDDNYKELTQLLGQTQQTRPEVSSAGKYRSVKDYGADVIRMYREILASH